MGLLIAIEGIDGSGKGTQAQRLIDRLEKSGAACRLISFPRYEATFFGRAVGEFLNGRFGSLTDVHPFLVSLLFAGDRFESRTLLTEALAAHDVVVLDRYVASNVAHQAAKADGADRESLVQAIEELEFGVYELPRPDRVILLDISVANAQKLIAQKSARTYTEKTADLQEADGAYLSRVRELYLGMARHEPYWAMIRCERDGEVRSIDDIASEVWQCLQYSRQE